MMSLGRFDNGTMRFLEFIRSDAPATVRALLGTLFPSRDHTTYWGTVKSINKTWRLMITRALECTGFY